MIQLMTGGAADASRAQTGTLLAMCLGTFMVILHTSLVNLGLHAIGGDLRANLSALQWVIDGYNLVYAVFILSGARLPIFTEGEGSFSPAPPCSPGLGVQYAAERDGADDRAEAA